MVQPFKLKFKGISNVRSFKIFNNIVFCTSLNLRNKILTIK